MTLAKAWVLIFVGVMMLVLVLGLLLAAVDAGAVAFTLLAPSVLCLGGFFNFLAVRRYGSAGRRQR